MKHRLSYLIYYFIIHPSDQSIPCQCLECLFYYGALIGRRALNRITTAYKEKKYPGNATLSYNSLVMRCVTADFEETTLSTQGCLPSRCSTFTIMIAQVLLRSPTLWPVQFIELFNYFCKDVLILAKPLNANYHVCFLLLRVLSKGH